MNNQNIVFFDGYCVLCNGFVDFLIRKDKNNNLRFASLQGTTAKKKLKPDHISKLDSIVFLTKQGQVFFKSQAVLHILNSLGGIWTVFKILNIIPGFLSDFVYDIIANNRYSWFGKRDVCRIPNREEKEKILP